MPVAHQLTTPVWLGLIPSTRAKLVELFDLKSTGQRSFSQVNGKGVVTSDGYTHDDLSVITLPKMAEYLKEPESTDFWKTFDQVLERIEKPVQEPQVVLYPVVEPVTKPKVKKAKAVK